MTEAERSEVSTEQSWLQSGRKPLALRLYFDGTNLSLFLAVIDAEGRFVIVV